MLSDSSFATFARTMAAVVLLGGLGLSLPAQAAQFSFEVRSDLDNSVLLGTGTIDTGSATLSSGSQTLSANEGLSVSFTSLIAGLSGVFSEADDDFDLAVAAFVDGTPVGLNFLVSTVSAPGGFGFASTIESLDATSVVIGFDAGTRFGYYTGTTFGTGTVAIIPEPSGVAGSLLLAGLGVRLGVRRRRR